MDLLLGGVRCFLFALAVEKPKYTPSKAKKRPIPPIASCQNSFLMAIDVKGTPSVAAEIMSRIPHIRHDTQNISLRAVTSRIMADS